MEPLLGMNYVFSLILQQERQSTSNTVFDNKILMNFGNLTRNRTRTMELENHKVNEGVRIQIMVSSRVTAIR